MQPVRRRTEQEQIRDELALLRRVVARHISDGITSEMPAAEVLARSLLTEIEASGVRLDVPEAVDARWCGTPGCGARTPHVVVPCGAAMCARCGFENPAD